MTFVTIGTVILEEPEEVIPVGYGAVEQADVRQRDVHGFTWCLNPRRDFNGTFLIRMIGRQSE